MVNQIQIVDISGKMVFVEYSGSNDKLTIPVANLSKGAYIMRIITDNGIKAYKFIKK